MSHYRIFTSFREFEDAVLREAQVCGVERNVSIEIDTVSSPYATTERGMEITKQRTALMLTFAARHDREVLGCYLPIDVSVPLAFEGERFERVFRQTTRNTHEAARLTRQALEEDGCQVVPGIVLVAGLVDDLRRFDASQDLWDWRGKDSETRELVARRAGLEVADAAA